jgi:hypothetical protein
MKRAYLPIATMLFGCLALMATCAQAAQAPADPRVALVVGNGAYKSSPLNNPVNDARAMARALKELGFEVLLRENITQPGFLGALREFGKRLKETGGVGLFYYAGHGMQLKGSNYLIPVDTEIQSEDEARYMAIDANQVLDKMEQAGNRLNIVILDACRDNPFARSFRSKQSGLAQMDAPSGMLVAFATAPGAVAYDGDSVNGVYTKHLLRSLTIPGLPIELVLKRVREGVSQETGQKQIPWESSSLLGDFYFKAATPSQAGGAIGQTDSAVLELAFWDSVKNSDAAQEYRAYLEKYPNGQFSTLARSRMDTLLAQAPASGRKSANAPTQVALATPSSIATPASTALARVGDTWTYNLMEGGWNKRLIGSVTITVTAVDAERIQEKVTRADYRSFGIARTFKTSFDPADGIQEIALPGKYFLVEFSPYTTAAGIPKPGGEWKEVEAEVTVYVGPVAPRVRTLLSVRAVGEERVRVPAGEFSTVKVEVKSRPITVFALDLRATANLELNYWYSPDIRRVVKISRNQFSSFNATTGNYDFELASFQSAK